MGPLRKPSVRSRLSESRAKSFVEVDEHLLAGWPLPDPAEDADKDERGRVLLIGGSVEMPGSIILAALGAMRAGAGKICVATAARVSQLVAQALPEARVIGLPETDRGGLAPSGAAQLPESFDAVLVGPGMQDEVETVAFTAAVIDRCADAQLVLDALAMSAVATTRSCARAIVITPHAGEMAHLTGKSKAEITAAPQIAAADASSRWGAVVALKGATTFIATPRGELWRHEGGNSGLAISGSGDVLAGIITGLAARGASAEQATVWGVSLHARAGAALAERVGPIGYLAREISHEIPRLMQTLASTRTG